MRSRMIWRMRCQSMAAVAFLGAVIVLGATGAGLAAPACATATDEKALNTRVLQTELMVAALSCGEQQRYNAFVNTFKTDLVRGGQGLKALFKRVHGARGDYQMNAFVTKLANEAAHRTANGQAAFCASAANLFNDVMRTPPGGLARITAKPEWSSRHGFRPC